MKRRLGIVITIVLCFILTTISVCADDGVGQNPDYVTDYYMVVQSAQGGVDIYDEADPQSTKLNGTQIPNGTAIHVLGEKDGTDNKKWAYTQYHGMNGYILMDDLDPVTRAEAVDKEYRTFGGKNVDFEVKVQGNGVNVPVYNGPGEKFDEVSGTDGIADGTTVHISQYLQGEDGTNWGKTDTDGIAQGWLNLDRDTDYVNENAAEDVPETTGTSGNVPAAAENITPTPEATPTPKATPTPEVTPTPEATPTPETTPTEEATPTPEATPTEEVTSTPEPEETELPAPEGKQSQETSGKNVKADSGMKNPVIWISGIGIIVIVILLIYFLKKKK